MSLKPLEQLPKTPLTIKRALLSVSDKTDILPLAKSLHAANVTLLSTGGTYKTLQNAGIPVTEVASLTGFPECLDGREAHDTAPHGPSRPRGSPVRPLFPFR